MTEKDSASHPAERPLSPHLQIYRWQLTMTMSILHRLTGAALAVGTVPLVLWLWGAAYSPLLSGRVHEFFLTGFGELMLMGWSFAFYYHLFNGVRHLVWDTGYGFEIHNAYRSGWTVVGVTLLATAGTWLMLLRPAGIAL